MFDLNKVKQTSSPSHHRSKSSPYFQHTRSFTGDQEISSEPLESSHYPVTCDISAPSIKANSSRLQRHTRSLTAAPPSFHPPIITTDIKIESSPAPSSPIHSSLFSTSHIAFDLSPPASPSISPAKEKERWSFLPNLRSEKSSDSGSERSASPLRISDWFQGESAPVAISVIPSPTKEIPEMDLPVSTTRMSVSRTATTDPMKLVNKQAGNTGFFSFFTNKAQAAPAKITPADSSDEFLNLEIKRALQPHGPVDPFSPSSFKNLQQTAEGLLAKMQLAYRQKHLQVSEAKAEQEAQAEELEEAQTRATHLKTQLDQLSSKLDDRQAEMQKLVEELQEEKRLRREEVERLQTIRVVEDVDAQELRGRFRTSLGSTVSTPSMLSDAGSEMNYSDLRHDDTPTSSPLNPRSQAWYHETTSLQYHLPTPTKKAAGGVMFSMRADSQDIVRENAELKARIRHLEHELDGCLDLLNGISLP
jgi:hypothetical protein